MGRNAGIDIGFGMGTRNDPRDDTNGRSTGDQRATRVTEADALSDGRGGAQGRIEHEVHVAAVRVSNTAVGQGEGLQVQPLQGLGVISGVLE